MKRGLLQVPGRLRRALAALALLAVCEHAAAGNILRAAPSGGPTPATASADAAAQAAAVRTAAAGRQETSPLRRALDAIKGFQASQEAARAAALRADVAVPNGLGTGGLDRADGGTWTGAGAAAQSVKDGRTQVVITQTGQRAVLTWDTFNVGRETDLVISQDDRSWAALNRVLDPEGRPSQILGSIQAKGQVYVINRNGIVFGGASQVNVGSLVTSGLELRSALSDDPGASPAAKEAAANERFLTEALQGLSFEKPSWGPAPQGDLASAVQVDAGARLAATSGGRIVLLGGTVRNGGTLASPDGQVYLAAGSRVQLLAPSDSDLSAVRGLAPPQDVPTVQNSSSGGVEVVFLTPLVALDGPVVNTGVVTARRGNITLVGAETRQEGLVTATTGAEAAGSIVLGQAGLRTTLTAGSVTQVLPDVDETERLLGAGETYRASSVRISGERVDLLGDAAVYAPGGSVTVRALATGPRPGSDVTDPTVLDPSRIYVDTGARIDVSGLRDVEVAMEQNAVKAELRANELRDNPLLRDGPLRSKAVWFDGRLGTKLADGTGFADLSGYYDLTEHTVSEFMTGGGSITLSANQLVAREGSTVDVSGGSLRYLDGYVRRTTLIDEAGRRVAIEDAVKGVRYVGQEGDFLEGHDRWGQTQAWSGGLQRARPRFEEGYIEGRSAGSIQLGVETPTWLAVNRKETGPVERSPSATAAVRILDGVLRGDVVVGERQRELGTGSTDPTRIWRERPLAGSLSLTGAGDVSFSAEGPLLAAEFGADSAVDPSLRFQHRLSTEWFGDGKLGSLSIDAGYDPPVDREYPGGSYENRAAGGHLTVDAGTVVDLGAAGQLTFTGKAAGIDGTIRAPGGKVTLRALQLECTAGLAGCGPSQLPATSIALGAAGVIDVAGRFTNDTLAGAQGPIAPVNGGSVSLTATAISLAEGSRVEVAGGARLDPSARLTAGNGGSITLDVSRRTSPDPVDLQSGVPQVPGLGTIVLGGTLDGRAAGKGGSLTLRTGRAITLGVAAPADDVLALDADFLTRGGFASYTLVGERGVRVEGAVAPAVDSFALEGETAITSGARLAEVAGLQRLGDPTLGFGLPMALTLSTGSQAYESSSPEVVLAEGASIRMAPGSTVTLDSRDLVQVDGTIEAAGGRIALLASGVGGRGVVLGDGARLLVPGYEKTSLDAGRRVRALQAGGSILVATGTVEQNGKVVAATTGVPVLSIAAGALLDASGAAGEIDLAFVEGAPGARGRYRAVAAASAGGAISLVARQGTVAGELRLGPGDADGALAVARGGSLLLSNPAGRVVVAQGVPASLAAGQLGLSADRIDASGADAVTLRTPTGLANASSSLVFEGDVELSAGRSLVLQAPRLGVVAGQTSRVHLAAAYVALEGAQASATPVADSAAAGSSLTVEAELIDVARTLALGPSNAASGFSGFASVRLDAGSGDLRLSNQDLAGQDVLTTGAGAAPGLQAPGDLVLAGGQVYVASQGRSSRLTALERPGSSPGFLVSASGRIRVEGPAGGGEVPAVPLSFGERLTLRAASIEQAGVLRAPAGQLRLEATGSVVLEEGSVTSVSLVNADGTAALVPFGVVTTDGVFLGYGQAGQGPTRSVELTSPSVTLAPGATLDVSGGGDLVGYTFVPGNGGSADVLGASDDEKGNVLGAPALGAGLAAPFAILPSSRGAPSPIGPVDALRDSRLEPGDQVWLEGVPGLEAGYYTLLPARYAILPGALLVQPLGGSLASAPATYVRPDGAVVTAGYRGVNGERRDAGYGRWAVMDAATFAQYGRIETPAFDTFSRLNAAEAGLRPVLLADGGSAAIAASGQIVLGGQGRFAGGAGGSAGTLDLSSSRLAVASAASAEKYAGWVVLSPDELTAFGAGSLLLGGRRSTSTTAAEPGTVVDVTSAEVAVDTAGVPWVGQELLLAAKGAVTVADGSVLAAEGAAPATPEAFRLAGDGAFLRVSSGGRAPVVRAGNGTGSLTIGDASLTGAGAVTLDAAGAVALDPGVELSAPRLDLASSQVHLGDAPAGTSGTVVRTALAASLSAGSDLVIRGRDGITLHGTLDLGGAGARLALDTPLLAGAGTSTVHFAGEALELRNSGAAASGAPADGDGVLTLDVARLVLGPGDVRVAGISTFSGEAGRITIAGSGALLLAGGLGSPGAAFATSRIETASGASYDLTADGDVALGLLAGPGALPAVGSLGGRLSITGAVVSLDTAVAMPAGTFEATATAGALSLGQHATVDVIGRGFTFVDVDRPAPGGNVKLAASGDLTLGQGSSVDVSAAAGGDGGTLELTAGGTLTAAGALAGNADAGRRGAAISIDASRLTDFSALNDGLEQAGFADAREFRLRGAGEELSLAAGDRISAHDVTLRADAGRVNVAGAIGRTGDAGHAAGGRIELSGGAGVDLAATAAIDARAAALDADGFTPAGGRVLVASTGGPVSVRGAIDLTGGREAGRITVRAPRTADGVDAVLEATITGSPEKVLQGVAVSETDLVDAAWLASQQGEAAVWLAAARVRSPQGVAGFELATAIEARSAAGLRVTGALSLSGVDGAGAAVAGGPGWLGLSAAGDLEVDGVLSDGFAGAARDAKLLAGRSFTLDLEAGGDLALRRGALVRTGTGDLALRAGGELTFDEPTPTVPQASVYTAGEKTAWAAGFGNVGVPASAVLGEFATGGGNVELRAGGDLVAPTTSQSTSAWLFRQGATDEAGGTVAQQASWSVVHANFQQSVGALGGGDVRVRAGGDVIRLAVAIPTTGQQTTAAGAASAGGDLAVRGGGDLSVSALGDVRSGLFVLGRGAGEIRAGGAVTADPAIARARTSWSDQATLADRPVGVLAGLGDATLRILAGGAATVQGAYDPMRQGQIAQNLRLENGELRGTTWSGYSERTALEVTALGGDVAYVHDPWAATDLTQSGRTPAAFRVAQTGSDGLNELFGRAPPTLRLASLSGDASLLSDLAVARELELAPSPVGTLEVLAKQDVRLRLDAGMGSTGVRGASRAVATTVEASGRALTEATAEPVRDALLHAGDREPARIYALDGSVCAQGAAGLCTRQPAPRSNAPGIVPSEIIDVRLAKSLRVVAGKDVLGGDWVLQGNAAEDTTVLSAGRDVYQPILELYGVGSAFVLAGRNVELGEGTTTTRGAPPLSGGALLVQGQGEIGGIRAGLPSDRGVDLFVLAGVKPDRVDYLKFAEAYLDPANATQRAIRDYVAPADPAAKHPNLRAFMKALDPATASLSEAELVAAFDALPEVRRATFLLAVLFTELRDTGIDYNDPESPRYQSYDRGTKAVATLFPLDLSTVAAAERANLGSVLLRAKRVETNASGSITVLAPYGRVQVGTEALQAAVDYGRGGVVTRRGGDIRILADQNIDLLTSRVFTLQGGDITMWTSNGDITAGSGSKTSVFQKPLSYTMTSDALVRVDAFGLQTGAGIGVLDALEDAAGRDPSRLDLIAPNGEVNAGDAGIRVVGSLNIAAAVVTGIENIQVSGASQGVPKVEAPNIGALTTASAVAQAAAKEGAVAQPGSQSRLAELPSIITVEVVGYEESADEAAARKRGKKK